ncbi:MAG: serine--tRNA ligase [Halieaceae bacterium]|nr:serine--tRNA ligase [Halieaceae bacterium]|tara:strand:+ start:1696 stop:2997 length:1302 start_codon:yes stop_codon:yes gene_type:complete
MLDIKAIRQDPDAVVVALKKRGLAFDLERFQSLDARRKTADVRAQGLLAERKSASKRIGELIAEGKSVDDAKAEVDSVLSRLGDELEAATAEAEAVQSEIETLLLETPNLPDERVPHGVSEDDNIEVLKWGEPKALDFAARDHVDLGEALAQMDMDAASRIAGSRFSLLSDQIARLHRALAQFMLDQHTVQHGYREVYVPYIVNEASLTGTGQLPKFAEDLFRLEGDQGYFLAPTAEVPVTNIARDRIFDAEELGQDGLRFVSHTPCFRSEAGSYGRDTRGLIRQHQFEKVELVQLVRPKASDAALESLTGHAEAILQALQLPYRKVMLCGGDLGFSAALTYDLEVWLPGQSAYREISSCSNFRDYQARRLQARWRNPETGKPELLHTLNGSGLAVGRTLVAVMENGQQADGSIALPEVIRPYMGGAESISPQ